MKVLQWPAVFLGAVVVQWWWSTHLAVFGLAPQVLFLLVVAVASSAGPVPGQCFAFGWGLALDVMAPHLFGGNALVLTLLAYLVGVGRRQMDVTSPVSQAFLVALLTPVYSLALSVVGLVFEGDGFWADWKALCLLPLYNAVLAPIGFAIGERIGRLGA